MSSVRDAITDLPEPAPNYLIYHDGAAYILKNTTTKAVASNTSEAGVLFNIAIGDLTTKVGSIHFHGGPHDTVFTNLKVFFNGAEGMVTEVSSVYNGAAAYIGSTLSIPMVS
jgi:hypothetical protein